MPELERVLIRIKDPADPERCPSVGKFGQCPYKKAPGKEHCPRHQGSPTLSSISKDQRLYMVAKYEDRISRIKHHPQFTSVREEVAILRMTLENVLDTTQGDPQQLLMRSSQITEMVREIGKVNKLSIELEKAMNLLLDPTQAKAWISDIAKILAMYIPDAETLEAISEDLFASLERIVSNNVTPER